jgi:hypothetical protein
MAITFGPQRESQHSQPTPLNPTRPLHYLPDSEYATANRSDLTSNMQFCDPSGFADIMASDQDPVDMEAFQRLSNTYQPDVQVLSPLNEAVVLLP